METDTEKMDATNHHGNTVRCKHRVTIRKPLSVGHRILVDWFDTWQWFLTLIGLYIFFSYVVKLPILFLGVINPIYAYSWIGIWIIVGSLLAYRELIRRSKTVTSPKWFHNPNAINEYLELMKTQSLED